MKWRPIDNMIASKCIQEIQKDIKEGRKRASDFIPVPGISDKEARELYSAWRVYFIDRMMEEYDKMGWKDTHSVHPVSELDYDIEYYKTLVEKEKSKK